jgi:hypothetical protein
MRYSWVLGAFVVVGAGCGLPVGKYPKQPQICTPENTSLRCRVGGEQYDALVEDLTEEQEATPEEIDEVIRSRWDTDRKKRKEGDTEPLSPGELSVLHAGARVLHPIDPASQHRYYHVGVYHDRWKTNETPERPMHTGFKFPYKVPVVRISLPQRFPPGKPIATKIGLVNLHPNMAGQGLTHGNEYLANGECPVRSDHWYGSVEQLARDWKLEGVTRVDLITTARTGRKKPARFAAIGFYLVYQNDETVPSRYVIEAGEALDTARQVFMSDKSFPSGIGFAEGWSTYNPSLLSNPMNWYKSYLKGARQPDGEWHPTYLFIDAFHTTGAGYSYPGGMASAPYVTVAAGFDEFFPAPGERIGLGRTSIQCIAGGHVHDIGRAWNFDVLDSQDQKNVEIARAYAGRLCAAESFKFDPYKTPEAPAESHVSRPRVESHCQRSDDAQRRPRRGAGASPLPTP